MDNGTQLNLEQQIAQWRRSLGGIPSVNADDIEEVESHLRDTIEQLQRSGLSNDEAFLIAARRVGTVDALEGEFSRAHPVRNWKVPALWMFVGILSLWLLSSIGKSLMWITIIIGSYTQASDTAVGITSLLVQCLLLGLALLWFPIRMKWQAPRLLNAQGLGSLLLGLTTTLVVLKAGELALNVFAVHSASVSTIGLHTHLNSWARIFFGLLIIGTGATLAWRSKRETQTA